MSELQDPTPSPGTLAVGQELDCELLVVGGGLAGVCTALAAARHGAQVILVQDRPVLGGNSSSEIRVAPVGADVHRFRSARETGTVEELFLEARARIYGGEQTRNGEPYALWDLILKEKVEAEPTIRLFLNCRAVDIETAATSDSAGYTTRIAAVLAVQTSTEKVYRFRPKLVVDATGDGSIAFRAGAPYRMGREARREFDEWRAPEEPDQEKLGSSMMFSARDAGRPVPFTPPPWAYRFPTEESLANRNHRRINSGYWWIEWGGHLDTIADNETIRDELTKGILGVWDHIKNHCIHKDESANFYLDWVGQIPGKRESRRFEGDYILTQRDVEEQRVFPDQVAYGGWPIDLHPSRGILQTNVEPCDNPQLPGLYSIPFRCLYSRAVSNLFLTGRTISVTHAAFGSTRVQKTGAVAGQAVGTASVFCLAAGLAPREWAAESERLTELQQALLRDGCYLIGLRNEDSADLAPTATAAASSEATMVQLVPADGTGALPLTTTRVQAFIWSGGRLDAVQLLLANSGDAPTSVHLELKPSRHLHDFEPCNALSTHNVTLAPGNRTWVSLPVGQELAPGCYFVQAEPEDPMGSAAWAHSPEEPVGTQAAEWAAEACGAGGVPGLWHMTRGGLLFRLQPSSLPYGPANVLSGVTRPVSAANVWISDPTAGVPSSEHPQWLELDFGQTVRLDQVELTFDSNLDLPFREPKEAPITTLVRDYRLLAQPASGAPWEDVLAESGNYQRRRVHRLEDRAVRRLRLEVTATNGAPVARVAEVRAYPSAP
ncbi:MAG: pyridine nucleotide-disulfide oxidoreductase [Dehalococcoidia bacterium]|nr:pyridine nucleotide-disulfide oxidoreductase [Dehalococcoidia bacterium]